MELGYQHAMIPRTRLWIKRGREREVRERGGKRGRGGDFSEGACRHSARGKEGKRGREGCLLYTSPSPRDRG
eukprot:1654529-Rhodomonas_salina.1